MKYGEGKASSCGSWITGLLLYCLGIVPNFSNAQVLAEGEHFEVVANTLLDARRILVRAEALGERFVQYLGPAEIDSESGVGPLPVRITIEDSVDLSLPEVTWDGAKRQLLCAIDASVFEDEVEFHFRLTKAWIARWTWVVHGESQIPSIPHWFIVGLAMEFLAAQHPALPTVWGENMNGIQCLGLEELERVDVLATRGNESLRFQSWLLLRSIMRGTENLEERREILDVLLRGLGVEAFVSERLLVDLSLGRRVIEAWWQVTLENTIWSPERSALSIFRSRFEVERLASWWSEDEASGLPVWYPAEGFLDAREETATDLNLINALEARILAIKLKLPEINPVYANTLISLGRYYESLLVGEIESAELAWTQFSQDWAFAREIGAVADRVLGGQ